jgi:UDP-glucose:glycoprotein glucosyltransferase
MQNLQRALSAHTQFLQQEIYLESITDNTDVDRFFYDLPTSHTRRNPYIFPSPEKNPLKIVNLVDAIEGVPASFLKSTYIEGSEWKLQDVHS